MKSTTPLSFMAKFATLGPLGSLRPAPGTIGSLVAAIAGYAIASYGHGALIAATFIVTVIGVFAADAYAKATGRKDPSEVIIDEVAGQWLTLIILPHDIFWYAAGFALFRLFDIVKPGPVRQAEALPGGIGVMADDLVAGLLSALCLWIAALLLGISLWGF